MLRDVEDLTDEEIKANASFDLYGIPKKQIPKSQLTTSVIWKVNGMTNKILDESNETLVKCKNNNRYESLSGIKFGGRP